jgi:hypothetical protein
MIAPSSGKNTVLQLNMGEGKVCAVVRVHPSESRSHYIFSLQLLFL